MTRALGAALALTLAAIPASVASAQAAAGRPTNATSNTANAQGAQASQGAPNQGTAAASVPTTPPALGNGPLLDAPVSRTQYRVGPGDVLDIALVGDLNRITPVAVAPEGTILIPGVGPARVLGLNIDDAERRIRDLVLRYYRNVDVKVSLAQVRSFKVFVVGDVASPGVRAANAATRVSELLPDAPNDGGIRHRTVVLRRASGDTLSIDLLRFRQTGDLRANPTLREGDAIVVPAIDQTVEVFGRVAFPGSYEYRRGETLADLLYLVNGGGTFPSDAADTIRVSRFVSREQREFREFSREQAVGAEGSRFVLSPADAIFVSRIGNYKVQRTAVIIGQVVRPGTYPIRQDTTTVRELVALAGGFTADASLSDAALRRVPPASEVQGARRLASVPTELLTSGERRILQAQSQSDPTRVVVNFEALFATGRNGLDQTLEAGDTLTVPIRRTGVAVLGAVVNPGIVPYVPGRGLDYYVGLAGGYARRADRSARAVLKSRFGGRADARDPRDIRTVDAGDEIVVPFRDRSRVLENLQTTAAVIGTVTGALLSLYTIRQLSRGQ